MGLGEIMPINEFITTFTSALPLLIKGLVTTIKLWLTSFAISLTMGSVWGILRSNKLRIYLLSELLDVITFVLRGIPFFVQLLLAYFVLPALLTIDISPSAAAASSLGLCSAAYVSQIIRGAINTIDPFQWEAAQMLGYSMSQTVRRIIIPQAFKNILPALTGEFDQLLKTTAVFSTIGILELTGVGKNIVAQEMNPLSTYGLIAVLYLSISSALAVVSYYAEKRLQ
jgi:His/Glu/Gln/Arg/opine family amino acid ABC transporter permease subunit